MIHTLKLVQPFYDAVESGTKTFEVRKDDREYETGDIVVLREYEPTSDSYSGRQVEREITYILRDPAYVKEGYVIFGIGRIAE